MSKKLNEVIRPLTEMPISLRKQRKLLHELFATAVCNAPENETENYTANKFSPVYLALCDLFENIRKSKKKRKPKIEK